MNARRWKIAECDSALGAKITRELNIPAILSRCLLNRGCVDPDTASRYLEPRLAHLKDPFLLPNMDKAVAHLLEARQNNEPFVIFGDYDVDGVTSSALLSEFFRALGWHSHCYLPHRIDEGYGLSREAVQNCLERFAVKLMIAVDCGSTADSVISDLAARGIQVIVLDHHQVGPALPPALALINPQLGADPEAKHLCSAGLAFKLAHALLKQCRARDWPGAQTFDLKQFLDLVALGTIADIVPLRGENRILVRTGLEKLRATSRLGLSALKKVAGINGTVGCHEVGFQLGPRLNAAGRLETALDALDLLLTDDPARATQLAETLDLRNRERQALEQRIADEAISAVRSRFNPATDFAIVEGQASWHLGVVGIVASRVVREFYRPVIVLGSDGSDEWRGSGRSIEGFDLAASLRGCADLLVKHGGHAMAAGVTLSPAKLEAFRARLNQIAGETLPEEALRPIFHLDAEVALADLTFSLLRSLERIQPVGQGNPPIQFAARRLQLRGEPKCVGNGQQHLRFTVTDGRAFHQALWWNCDPGFVFPPLFDLAFAPELNEYNGTFAIQLKVLDIRPSDE